MSTNDQTSSVIATLTFNGVLGAVLMLLFEVLRTHQVDVYAPKTRKANSDLLPKLHNNLFGWVYSVWKSSDDDVIHLAGLDAYIFLRYLKICTIIVTVCCFGGLFILFPVYATSSVDVDDDSVAGITLLSMANIPPNSKRLWASLLCVYMFTLTFLYCIHKEYENFLRVRTLFFKGSDPYLQKQTVYSIQVENIPKEFQNSKKLKQLFEGIFPNEVLHSYVAVNLQPLEKLVEERKVLMGKLEGYIAQYEASNRTVRPKVLLRNGNVVRRRGDEKVDAIEFYYDQISILSEEIHVLQTEARLVSYGPTEAEVQEGVKDSDIINEEIQQMRTSIQESQFRGTSINLDRKIINFLTAYKEKITNRMISATGFVTFASRRTQAVAAQLPHLSEDYLALKATAAPAPSDIIWSNTFATTEHTESMSFITSLLYYAGLVFWATVLAFIAAISNLSTLETYLPFLKQLDSSTFAILQGILPVVVMILFLNLLPVAMGMISQYVERRKTFSSIQQEVFKWYFMYQLANVYLTLLTGSAFTSIGDVIDDPQSILNYISAALPASSVFFMNFIITQIFSGVPLIFLRIFPTLLFALIRYGSSEKNVTRRMLVEGPLADMDMDYGTTLPNALYVLCITLLYWVISPFVIVLAVLYFGGSYIAYKYQYLYVLSRKFESGGLFWYGLYSYSMMGLFASTLTFMTYMSIKQAIIQAPLTLPLPFIIIYAWRHTESKFKELSQNVPYSTAVRDDLHSNKEEVVKQFNEDYLKQPNIVAPKQVFPYPYRINQQRLFDNDGLVNEVYLQDIPEGADPLPYLLEKSYIPPNPTTSTDGCSVKSPVHENQIL